MERPHAAWQELGRAAGHSDRFGCKAERLARVATRFPVVAGWVLDTSITARLGRDDARRYAEQLLALDPTRRWILRSSSPLEDTASSSAAGLFASVSSDAVTDALTEALLRVVGSAADPRVIALLAPDPHMGPLPLAVLAQPHLEFRRWCTVEARAEGTLLEGWALDRNGVAQDVRASLDQFPAPWSALRDLAVAVRADADALPILMELGEDGDGNVWLLQVRAAPQTAPRWASPDSADTAMRGEASTAPTDVIGLGANVHPGDDAIAWVWDLEHCPTALCPLLAGLFGPWIAAHASYPSRLIQGRWHDRVRDASSPGLLALDEVDRELDVWRRHEEHELRPGLEILRAHVASPWSTSAAPQAWQDFTQEWLRWQRLYFDVPSGRLRRWARTVLESRGPDLALSLGTTVASERARRWADLTARLRAHPAAPPRSAQALRAWAQSNPDDALARDLHVELERCGHLCTWAYDGRGVPWEFEPLPFWRALALRVRRGEKPPHPSSTLELDAETTRARTILVRAEDDDDLLLVAYQQWHRAVRRVAEAAGVHAPARVTDLLDLLPDDLLGWMQHHDAAHFDAALARGRALARAWDAGTPDTEDDPTTVDRVSGIAAAPGRAEGVVRRVGQLGQLDTDDGERDDDTTTEVATVIAVVTTVGPADALHITGLGGLVCEGGDVLGHASVLAREHGVPCVVGVVNARRRFAHATRLLVDGDRGEVVVTARRD